ncbi:hypothetical protein JCM10908_001737 [Rhodotorula pacifica]|uniref:uncharacterized protein n=1 Tax=Rhodotorula pacifica TaxID=1495444 RepID=UPI003175BC9D
MSSTSPTDASPPAQSPDVTSESVPAEVGSSTNADRTRHKRPRAAVDPSTPKGEGEDGRTLSNFTPLAKKGRVEGEDEAGSDPERPSSPPPIASTSRPSTPTKAAVTEERPLATEGKDTKKLRERVAAMKPPGQEGEPAAGDVEIADVAAEVSTSAAKLGDEQDAKEDKDVEIAEVAAEVGTSAQEVDKQEEQLNKDKEAGVGAGESKEQAETAAEVAESAAQVQATDERIADTADEVAEAAKAAPEPTPAPTPKPTAAAQPTFANYSSTASPFSAFASNASPLGSVATPKPAPEAQKPKAKSSFSATTFSASNVPLSAAVPTPASQAAAEPSSSSSTGETPSSTPFTKAAPTTNLASASPFSSFASTSGFASATKKTPGSSAFSAFSAAPSAFSSIPASTAASASDAASAAADSEGDKGASPAPTASGTEGRKVGEPEERDASKPVFTEKELVTGEEEEETLHQVKCKLYAMSEGQWAERGTGPIRLNQTAAKGDKHGARLVMRADATHRLLLNAPLFHEFSIEVSNEKYVRFTVIEGGNPISYMLRTGNPTLAANLVEAVREKVATL